MGKLSVRLLGPFQVTLDREPVAGFHSDKVRALLAYLVVETDGPHRREKLAGLLWPDLSEQSARANLRRALANLRQVIGDSDATPCFLDISRQAIQLNCASDAWVDVTTFTDLLSVSESTERLEEMVKLYRGSFLEGFSIGDSSIFEEWALLNRERIHRLVIETLQRLVARYVEQGDHERALQHAWRQVGLDPWREKSHQQLMQLLALAGQRWAAITQYETFRGLLDNELGVEPAAETVQLYDQIKSGGGQAAVAPPSHLPDEPAHRPSFLDAESLSEGERPVFVARERELERMYGFLETALGGKGSVVFVTGGAGRGKTALLDEFARRALKTYPTLLVTTGNCNAYFGAGDPYLPFRDVMALLTGDVQPKWAAGAITRDHARRLWEALPDVARVLADRGPELMGIFLPARELVARAMAVVPGGADWLERLKESARQTKFGSGGLEQSHLFEQYANVLRGIASQRPLLIVLDDLQWADVDSVSLLFHLGRRIEGSRILIAGAYRPDEIALGRDGGRHPLETVLTEFKRYFGDVWVDLSETKESESREFMDALLGTEPNRLDEDFRQTLFRRTRGHPLFTIELLRAMKERGDLVQDAQGRWIVGPVLDWETLPARVEGVIEERVGRLRPELREILSVASVEGEEFTAQVVARVQQIDERQVMRALSQELEKRHNLVQEREQVQVEHQYLSRYHFTHLLFQQYLYNGLGVGERRLLHREIGAALEELYKGCDEEIAAIAPQLVRHYAGDVERERHYARLAGERAAAQFANAEALYYLNLAIDLTPEKEAQERYAILLTREKVFHLYGDREAQRRDLVALEHLVEVLNDDDLQAAGRRVDVALRQARYAEAIGDYPAVIAAAQAIIGPAQISQDMNSEAAGHLQWGRALWRLGEYKAARLQFEQALNLARTAGARQALSRTLSRTMEADSLHNLGLVCWLQGDYIGAKAYPAQSLRLYRELGNRRRESMTLNTLGIVASEQGNYTEAEKWLKETLHITCEIGDRRGEARAEGNLGLVYAEYGNYAEAMTYFERSLDTKTAIDDREGMCGQLSNLSLLFHHQGNVEAAWEYGQRALSVAQEIGSRRWEGYAFANLGRVLEGRGRLEEAIDAYQQSLALRRELDQNQLAIDVLAGLVRVFLAQDDLPQVQVHVETTLSYLEGNNLEGIEEPFWVYLTCYQALRAAQDARAEAILNTAHRLLQERATRISDEGLRRSFLENVAAHREIVREFSKRKTVS